MKRYIKSHVALIVSNSFTKCPSSFLSSIKASKVDGGQSKERQKQFEQSFKGANNWTQMSHRCKDQLLEGVDNNSVRAEARVY